MMENRVKIHLLENPIVTFGNFRIKILYFEDKTLIILLSEYSYSLRSKHI